MSPDLPCIESSPSLRRFTKFYYGRSCRAELPAAAYRTALSFEKDMVEQVGHGKEDQEGNDAEMLVRKHISVADIAPSRPTHSTSPLRTDSQ